MNRAQRRAAEKQSKQKQKRPATYNVTRPMLHSMVHQEIEKDLKEQREETFYDAVNQAMLLLLVLPMEVLMDYYLDQDQFREVIPEFTSRVLEYYEKWQNDELDMDALKKDLWEYGGVKLEEGNEENNYGKGVS